MKVRRGLFTRQARYQEAKIERERESSVHDDEDVAEDEAGNVQAVVLEFVRLCETSKRWWSVSYVWRNSCSPMPTTGNTKLILRFRVFLPPRKIACRASDKVAANETTPKAQMIK
jgi:hypothetical protein